MLQKVKSIYDSMFMGVLIGLFLGFAIYAALLVRNKSKPRIVDRDTIVRIDTIPHYLPVAKDSIVVKYITRYFPIAKTATHDTNMIRKDLNDSAGGIARSCSVDGQGRTAVEIPIIQKRYEGKDYLAYVSGYEPSLDSIFVYPKTTTIRERIYKPPNKWHIGITGGYGYSFKTKQATPYVGIGITYSLFSF